MILMACVPTWARHIVGRIVDAETKKEIVGATVELLSAKDSSVIRSTFVSEHNYWGYTTYLYNIEVENNTDYLLRVSALGYTTVYKAIKVQMDKRVNEQRIDDIFLNEDSHQLGEIVVKATKIKMVMRGDTIVYDASAFNLAEGSMLDALIRQLPGAKLDKGVITVNGRKVSSLLIDGRDFFNGDAKKALENLPAYTVKEVKAYEKAGKKSRLMGRDMGDKAFVLDVALRKEYQRGMMANIDLGGGTSERFSGKLFAMAYDRKNRLSVAANGNNVNDPNLPGENVSSDFMPTAGGGTQTKRDIVFDFNHEGKTEDDMIALSSSLSHDNTNLSSRTSTQTFLSGGDYYGLTRSAQHSKLRSVDLAANFGVHPKKNMLSGRMSFAGSKARDHSESLSGQFNENPTDIASVLDSLFLPNASDRLMSMAVNRVRNLTRNHADNLAFQASLNDQIAIGKGEGNYENFISLGADLTYSRSKTKNFAINDIDYLSQSATESDDDHRNTFTDSPQHNFSYTLSAVYNHRLTRQDDPVNTLFVGLNYLYLHLYNSSNSSLYRLDWLTDYSEDNYPLGTLPSEQEALLQTLDETNSYKSREHTSSHMINPSVWFSHGDGTRMPQWSVRLEANTQLKHERLSYYRQKQYDRSRNSVLISPMMTISYQLNDSTGTRLAQLTYNGRQSEPELVSLLGIHDDSNPLYVTDGNPNLKKSLFHSVGLSYNIFDLHRQRMFNANLYYSLTQRAVANAVYYDKSTGITHSRKVNVGGNWSLNGSVGLSQPVDRAKRFTLEGQLNSSFTNSVDLTSVGGTENPRSNVRTLSTSVNLQATYQLDTRLRIFANATTSNQWVTSDRSDFDNVNAWDNSCKIGGRAELPLGFQFSTDITEYWRNGYSDKEMNNSELVWNAQLTKKVMRNQLTLSLVAYDILGHISSTHYTLNSQGRTETWSNSIPRYLMLHAAYHFTMGAKKD